MNKEIELKPCREAFEAWFSKQPLTTVPHSGGYTREALEWAFNAGFSTRSNVIDTNLGIESIKIDLMQYIRAVCAANSSDTQYQNGIRDMGEVIGFWLENNNNFKHRKPEELSE